MSGAQTDLWAFIVFSGGFRDFWGHFTPLYLKSLYSYALLLSGCDRLVIWEEKWPGFDTVLLQISAPHQGDVFFSDNLGGPGVKFGP